MKKLILLTSFAFIGCTAPEIEEYQTQPEQSCGTIMSVSDDPNGDTISVKMEYMTPQQRSIYLVPDYKNYKLGSQICNFEGLTKLQ